MANEESRYSLVHATEGVVADKRETLRPLPSQAPPRAEEEGKVGDRKEKVKPPPTPAPPTPQAAPSTQDKPKE